MDTPTFSPTQRLRAALADVGAALEDMPHTERHDRVEAALHALGFAPPQARSTRELNFLVGCFVNAHYWTVERTFLATEWNTPTGAGAVALADLRTLLDQYGWRPGQPLSLTADEAMAVVALLPENHENGATNA